MTSNDLNPRRRRLSFLLPLAVSALILLGIFSCIFEDPKSEDVFNLSSLADSLAQYDSVQIILKSASGETLDMLFHGKVTSGKELDGRPAPHYHGGKTVISVIGFKDDEPVYQVDKKYDGQKTDSNVVVRVPSAGLQVDDRPLRLFAGDVADLPAATVTPAELADKTVNWSCVDGAVCSVAGGKLNALTAGETQLIARLASDSAKHASVAVKVVSRDRVPERLSVEPETLKVAVGGRPGKFTLTATPASASAEVTWKSLDSATAAVSQAGVGTGRKPGLAAVTAVSVEDDTVLVKAWIKVVDSVAVTGVTFALDSLELFAAGAAESLAVSVLPELALQDVDLSVGDASLAKLEGGTLRGLKAGATWVIARAKADPSRYDSLPVSVLPSQKIDSVVLGADTLRLYVGGPDSTLAVKVYPPDAYGRVLWRSLDPDTATVDGSGKVTAVAPGATRIVAVSRADASRQDTLRLRVKKDVPVLSVGQADTTVGVGATVDFVPQVVQEYGGVTMFKWDLDGDLAWDDSATALKTVSAKYDAAKTYAARFLVRDAERNEAVATKRVKAVVGPVVQIVRPAPNSYTNKTFLDTVIWMVDGKIQDRFTTESLDKEGANVITRTYTDTAGAKYSASITVYRDTLAPNKPILSGTGWSNSLTPTWNWSSGGGGGTGTYRHQLDDEKDIATALNDPDSTFDAPFNLAPGPHTLFVQERDQAGNWSQSGKLVIRIDQIAPSAPVTAPSHQTYSNRSLRPTFRWVSTASGGGAAGRYRVTFDTTQGFQFIAVDSGSYAPDKDLRLGWDTLFVEERDSASNWSKLGTVRVRVSTDTTPPTAPVFYATPVTPVNSATPKWTWRTGGNGGIGAFRVKVDDANLTAGATEISDTAFTSPALTEGPHKLYVQERDSAANWSAAAARQVVVANRRALGMTGIPTVLKEIKMTLTSTGTPILVTADSLSNQIGAYTFNGGSWDSLGKVDIYDYNSFVVTMGPNDKPYIGALNGSVDVKRFVDTGWLDLGPTNFSVSGGFNMAVNSLDDPHLVMCNYASTLSVVYHRVGNQWQQLGGNFAGGTSEAKIAFDANDVPYVFYLDNYSHPRVVRYEGAVTGWVSVGSGDPSSFASFQIKLAMDRSGTPVIGFLENPNSDNHLIPKVKTLKAGAWADVGGAVPVDSASVFAMALDPAGVPFIGYNQKGGGLGFMTLNGGAWVPGTQPVFAGGTAQYISVTVGPDGIPVALYGEKKGVQYMKASVIRMSFDP